MPPIYAILLGLLLFLNVTPSSKTPEKFYAKCYGYTPCTACSSCNYCAYCNAGGTCGVCKPAKVKKDTTPAKPVPSTKHGSYGQCKAITQKKTRCSRNAKANGYCWQHGG